MLFRFRFKSSRRSFEIIYRVGFVSNDGVLEHQHFAMLSEIIREQDLVQGKLQGFFVVVQYIMEFRCRYFLRIFALCIGNAGLHRCLIR